MKKLAIILVLIFIIVLIGGFLIYPLISNKISDNTYDFKPSIKQGIYGTALECHGSAEPPLKGNWNSIQINLKIENLNTNETIDVKTQENGRYEISLQEGSYMINVFIEERYIAFSQINIEKGSIIHQNIVTKFCPV